MLKELTLCALPLILVPAVSSANPLVPISPEDLVIIDEAQNETAAETDDQGVEDRRYGGYWGYYGGHRGYYGGHRGYYGGHRGYYGGHRGYYGGHHGHHGGHRGHH